MARKAGRPKGTPNKPDAKKPGRKTNYLPKDTLTSEQVLDAKKAVLFLFEEEKAITLTQAAELVGVPKLKLHSWAQLDKEWATQIRVSKEIFADRLEERLNDIKNFIPMMFLLKKIRPDYRDNARTVENSGNLERLLQDLKDIAEKNKPKETPVAQKE